METAPYITMVQQVETVHAMVLILIFVGLNSNNHPKCDLQPALKVLAASSIIAVELYIMFHYCRDFLSRKKLLLAVYLFLSIINGLISIALPLIISFIVDGLTRSKDVKEFLTLCGIFAFLYLFNIAVNCGISKTYICLQTQLGFEANKQIVSHLQNLPLSFYNKTDIAYLSQRVNNDANEVIIFGLQNCGSFLVNIVTIILVTTILIRYSVPITLLILGISIVYLLIYIAFRKKLKSRNYAFKESQSNFFSSLQMQLSNIKFLKLNALKDYFLKKWDTSFQSLFQQANKMQNTNNAFSFCTGTVDLALQLISYIFIGLSVIAGKLTIGFFIVVTNYITQIKNSLVYFYTFAQNYQKTDASFQRIKKIMDIPEQKDGTSLPEHINRIQVDHVSFNYGSNRIFSDYSVQFQKGKIYGIAGENGAGKSTLVDLMLGIHNDEYTGSIYYDNVKSSEINLYELRKSKLGITEQEPLLVKDTISANLTFGLPLDQGKVKSLATVLGMDDFMSRLPEGLLTVINEKSSNLSGGEKQKLSIMRLLLKNPELMIFDEPTSALDENSRNHFIDYLQSQKQDKIIIIVSHDQKLLQRCDKIIRL